MSKHKLNKSTLTLKITHSKQSRPRSTNYPILHYKNSNLLMNIISRLLKSTYSKKDKKYSNLRLQLEKLLGDSLLVQPP